MDNAIHFFDELKKGMQQVEQAMYAISLSLPTCRRHNGWRT